jgi:outer membrane protein assembly factor BamB
MFRAYPAPLIFIISLTYSLFASPPVSQPTEKPFLSRPLIKSWFFETVDTSDFTPTVHEELVFLPLADGTLVALDAVSGALQWRSEFGGYISAAPASDESGVYIATEIRAEGKSPVPAATGALRLIGKQSGVTLWVRSLHAPIRTALAVNSTNVFAGTVDGKLYSLKKSSGEVVWLKTNPSPFNSHPLLFDNRLYVGDEVGNLFAIEQNTGRTLWRYRTRGSLRASVAVSGGTVFAGSTDSNVYALSERTGRLRWRSRTGGGIQSVVATPRCVLATSLDNFAYCLSPQSGRRIWKRQLSGRVLSQPLAAPDGVLLAPVSGDECVVLDLNEGKKINSIDVGEDNNTGASPVRAGGLILLTTRKGLIAYSNAR